MRIASVAKERSISLRHAIQLRLKPGLEVAGRNMSARANRDSESVDYAVIDKDGRVMLVIELNDSSHDRPERRDRDKLVGAALYCGLSRPRLPSLPCRGRHAGQDSFWL